MEQGKLSVLQWNKHHNLLIQKQNKKYLILHCVKSDWFYLIQIWSLKQYFIRENCSKIFVCEIAMQT